MIKTSKQSWHTIIIDFIVKLLKSTDPVTEIEYNAI